MKCDSLENDLTKFRENYHSVKVTVYADCLVYRCVRGYSDKAAASANDLIERMNLDLVAISTNFKSKDSYEIKASYSEL